MISQFLIGNLILSTINYTPFCSHKQHNFQILRIFSSIVNSTKIVNNRTTNRALGYLIAIRVSQYPLISQNHQNRF